MSTDIIRVLRLVEYEGPRDLVEEQLKGSVYGTRRGISRKGNIGEYVRVTATTLGIYPEVIEEARRISAPQALESLAKEVERLQADLQDARACISDLRDELSGGEG